MDINNLLLNEKVPILRESILENYIKFELLDQILTERTNAIVNPMREALFQQFTDFFSENGFTITRYNETKIEAKNEIANIEFSSMGMVEDETIFHLVIEKKNETPIYRQIDIVPEFAYEERFYWKENINELISSDEDVEIKDIINEITDVNTLERISNSIEININWFVETIDMLDKISFIYTDPNCSPDIKEIRYKDFKDFFERI